MGQCLGHPFNAGRRDEHVVFDADADVLVFFERRFHLRNELRFSGESGSNRSISRT